MREPWPLPGEVFGRLVAPLAERLDRVAGWDRLPRNLGLVTLVGLRHRLRERNLYDGRTLSPAGAAAEPGAPTRSLDGSGNDPAVPWMGAARTRFGRNAPPVLEDDAALTRPPALEVSERLLTREEFFGAETLNLLAAAWLQFEVHDWLAHETDRDDPAYAARTRDLPDDAPSEPAPLRRDGTATGRYPAFLSDQTHWWDASQLYGAREDFARAMREGDGGRVKVDGELLAAMEPFTSRARDGTTAAVPNLWVGTALFHVLFAKEHNAICARLRSEHPRWDDDRLYEQARVINAAIMAKIHTVEWTPAVIAHPTAARGIRATWWGVLGRDHRRWPGALAADELLSGVPGSRGGHDGVPYALTEEFVAVYRLHPLLPDDVTFRRVADDAPIATWRFEDTAALRGRPDRPRARLEEVEAANAFYSLGVEHPGEITLHNYPRFLQELKAIDQPGVLNLGAVDIQRTRETGVPRYNNFRRLFRLAPASTFHEIANGNPKWAREIRDVYDGDLEAVDLMIGLFAERKPAGFAFSDTAFRVFLLMATRRLRSDRFFTTDFTPEVYTATGLRWIADVTLADMLTRHYPALAPALAGVANPFAPWPRVS